MKSANQHQDTRWIWLDEASEGPYSVPALFKMATAGEIGVSTLFWSESKQEWLPLPGLLFDVEPPRLQQMIAAGIERVEVLGTGSDCEACAALVNKVYPITDAPLLPPTGCLCMPWCRLVLTATD